MLKRDELRKKGSCLNKAQDDEPIFVLLARDPIAHHIVRRWADMAAQKQIHDSDKVEEARALADMMRDWRQGWRPKRRWWHALSPFRRRKQR